MVFVTHLARQCSGSGSSSSSSSSSSNSSITISTIIIVVPDYNIIIRINTCSYSASSQI